MRLTSLARRTAAVTAATALFASGGAVLAAPAFAAVPAATITSLGTTAWDNRSSLTMSLTGSGFVTGAGALSDVIVFTPDFTQTEGDPTWAADSTQKTEINAFTSAPASTATGTSSLQATVNLALAPAGLYKVTVRHAAPDNTESAPATQEFRVYGYGGASVNAVSPGKSSTGVDPLGVDCRTQIVTNCTPRGAGALDLTGSNIAVGATVHFYKGDVEDTALSFREGNAEQSSGTYAGTGPGTGYASSTLLQGKYSWSSDTNGEPKFTPGLHKLTIRNVHQDASASTLSTTFSQPFFAATGAVSPPAIGQGAQQVQLTVTGQGFTTGAELQVQGGTCNNAGDTSVGQATLGSPQSDGTFNTITAPVSFTSCAASGRRDVGVSNPSGAYFFRPGALTVSAAPTFTAISPSSDQTLGQGADLHAAGGAVTITGTGFSPTCIPSATTTCSPARMTTFDFGPGVTVTTVAVTSANAAAVNILVDSSAPVGQRSVTVRNPDGGSTTTAPSTLGGAPLTIAAGPQISSVSPGSVTRGASGTTVTVTGAFPTAPTAGTPNPYSVTLNGPSPVSVGTPTRVDASTLTFPVSVPPDAISGLRELVIKDVANQGQAICNSCFAVNYLTISPSHAPNTGSFVLTFTNGDSAKSALDGAIGPNSTITLYRQVPVAGQGPIAGTAITRGAAGSNQASATFNLVNAAPGPYSAEIVQDASAATKYTWSCAACFTVDPGGAVTISSITPQGAGQGVSNLPVSIKGTNFSKGMTASIAEIAVGDVRFVSTTELSAKVTVPSDTQPGAKDLTVTPASGPAATKAAAFTVTLAPHPTAVASGASYGQGAGTDGIAVSITVNADHGTVQPNATMLLGAGVTATTTGRTTDTSLLCTGPTAQCQPDTLTASLRIAQGAATGARDVVITNPDGGKGTLPGGFTVNLGPSVTSVANELGQAVLPPDGKAHKLTIHGAGFTGSSPATVLDIRNADGTVEYQTDGKTRKITVANVSVVDQGTTTADVTVATNAALAPRLITGKNGSDQGYGSCLSCFAVANPPSAPTSVAAAGLGGALQVSWAAAAPNGSPVTTYVVSLLRAGSTSQATAGACEVAGRPVRYDQVKSYGSFSRSAVFTGLTNGTTYVATLCAVNAAGQGAPVAVSGVAGLPDGISLGISASKIVYGQYVKASGRLVTASGAPLAGRTVRVILSPAVGRATYAQVYTSSTGAYSFVWKYAHYNTTVRAYFPGDVAYRPAMSVPRFFYVATRVTRTAPANFSRTSASTVLKITGYIAPGRPGALIYLYRYYNGRVITMARTTLSSRSTFVFAIKPGRGTYTFRVYFPAKPGNAAGVSTAFTLYRV